MDRAVYQEYYYAERSHWWFRARMRILAGMISRHVSKGRQDKLRILNVGVATGATSQMLMQFGDVTSLEYDQECCEFLRNTVGIPVVQGSVTELPFETAGYDLVCCFDVIEHVEDDATAVKELTRMVRPGGSLFVTVPAYMFLWSQHDVANHHYRRYTLRNFRQLFSKENLRITFRSYFNFFLFFPIATFRTLTRPFRKERERNAPRSDLNLAMKKGFMNQVLYHFFKLEKPFLLSRIPFPIGVSIMMLLQKPA